MAEEAATRRTPAEAGAVVHAAPLAGVVRLLLPGPYVAALRDLVGLLRRQRVLTLELAKREVRSEHAGLVLGVAWGVAQPLFMMAIYAFLFGVVFRVKVGDSIEFPRNFTIYLLSGLVPWLAFANGMARGSTAVTSNEHLVKQTTFPIVLLPVVRAIAACVPLAVGLAFVTVLMVAQYLALPLTYLLVPLLVLLQLVAMIGMSFALAAVGAFFRDIREIVALVSLAGVFVLPIVYLPTAVPDPLRPLLYANPFSYMVWCYQDAVYYGRFEHPGSWALFAAGSVLLFVLGYRLFRRLSPYFGNVV
jgi:lipopolysaccharide transport system permease protein